jgi:uncharacterized repeat protein (TIGR02543 family)
MAGDKTVTAHFSLLPITYELTMAVDPTGGGTTDPAVGVHTYPENEVVAVTATPNAGYEFDHWTGDVANPNSASTTVTMDGDKTVTAHFSLVPTTYELTMAVDPTGGGTTDPVVGVHTYPEDEVVAVTATPNAGYEFDHWTGDVADPNSASTQRSRPGLVREPWGRPKPAVPRRDNNRGQQHQESGLHRFIFRERLCFPGVWYPTNWRICSTVGYLRGRDTRHQRPRSCRLDANR